jgi:sugar phosphate isomerase/epimerase
MGRGKRPQRRGRAFGRAGFGLSTGWDPATREDWPLALAEAERFGTAVELSALSANELPGLSDFLAGSHPALGYLTRARHVSVHGPVKGLSGDWEGITRQLEELPSEIETIIMHPDTLSEESYEPLARLGSRLVLENMDCRKETCKSVDELAPVFARLPEAGFCLDVAHVWSVDQSLQLGQDLLDAFGDRLREVHVSGIELDGKHRLTTKADLERYAPLLERVGHVPWIFESPLVD